MQKRWWLIAVLVLAALAFPAMAEEESDTRPASSDADQVATRTANDGNVVLEAVPEIPDDLVAALRPYSHTRGAGFQDWTEDGTGVYISTRFGEVSQLHHVAMPGGARRQLTFFDEPIRGVHRQPGGHLLTFTSDEGGSEFYQVYLFDPRTGTSRRLTDGESRNGGIQWSDDGKRIAYLSTRRNGRSNDVWMMDVDKPDEARLAFESPDGSLWAPIEFSPGGDRLLVQNYVSIEDSRIHLLNLGSGESRPLAGSTEEHTANIAAGFDHDGTGIYLRTNAQSDFMQLAHLDLANGEVEILTADIPWDVDGFILSDDGRRAVFGTNEGGVSRPYLMDPATHAYRRIENIPIGLFGGGAFSPDSSRLALTLNTSRSASDVFALELGEGALDAGELVRWTTSEVGGLDTDAFAEPELITYPTFDQVDGKPRQIPAFVYRPPGEGPHPVIISIHGGPEAQFRPGFNTGYQTMIDLLGAAVIAPNVRGSSGYGKTYVALDNGFGREDSVKDIGALLDWITTQPDLDQNRVAVFGGSYGGYMVLASMVHYSDRLKAGVDIVGISNFVTFLENTQDYRRDLRRVEYGDERDEKMRAFLERVSPNNNAAKITAPLLVAQGQNDPRVPVTESEQIVRDVRAAGFDVWYMNALNEGHGFRKKENRDLFSQVVMLFLREYLLGEG